VTTQAIEDRPDVISYDRLYRLWEQGNWSATAIDFSVDATQWAERLTDTQRRAAVWNYAMFLVGEDFVEHTLTPLIDAAPDPQHKTFLATQLVDEARHNVFFSRFLREVAGHGRDPATTIRSVESELTWGFRKVFEELDQTTRRLRRKPHDLPLLAQSIALYHFVIEATLALAGQHFIQRYIDKMAILPGFAEGIAKVSRDESRHVAFGVKLLGDLVHSSDECRAATLELFERVMPWAAGVFVPPGFDRSYTECFDFTLEEIYAFGLRSFETKLRRIGIEPTEIELLRYDAAAGSYEERARREWVLIRAGVFGDDRRTPSLDDEAIEIIFDGLARVIDVEKLRDIGGFVEWDFTDREPWHVVAANGTAEARRGPCEKPSLRFRVSASNWALIVAGRLSRRAALLSGRLRARGSVRALARAGSLFEP
jgi:1,2-phenylacetyl-CoA epoxidase catalytic subunit